MWDDGPGFGLNESVQGHGLDLLRGRLPGLHGAAAALTVDRRDGGVAVALRLPRQEEEGT